MQQYLYGCLFLFQAHLLSADHEKILMNGVNARIDSEWKSTAHLSYTELPGCTFREDFCM